MIRPIDNACRIPSRILILGVNPFEDLPGYQLLGILKSIDGFEVYCADDSLPARTILSHTGMAIEEIPHPSAGVDAFASKIIELCRRLDIDILIPATDAQLLSLAHALERHPNLGPLCPTLKCIAAHELYTKRAIQNWLGRFCRIPRCYSPPTACQAMSIPSGYSFPVMVKGIRKGAVRCDNQQEVCVAIDRILKNPANTWPDGSSYLEEFIDGPEHSLFLLVNQGMVDTWFAFSKLAVSAQGTTLAGLVDYERPNGCAIHEIAQKIEGPAVVELEWRRDSDRGDCVFEANLRFPSWIGALGRFGSDLVCRYLELASGREPTVAELPRVQSGQLFYRLPESGFLALAEYGEETRTVGRDSSRMPLLWPCAAPHQFLHK